MKTTTKITIGFFLLLAILLTGAYSLMTDKKPVALASSPASSSVPLNVVANSDEIRITEKDALSAIDMAILGNIPKDIIYSGSKLEILDNNKVNLKSYFVYTNTGTPFSLTASANFFYKVDILTVKIDDIKLSKVTVPDFVAKNLIRKSLKSSQLSNYVIDNDTTILINLNNMLSKYGQKYKVSTICSRNGEIIVETGLVQVPKPFAKKNHKTTVSSGKSTVSSKNKSKNEQSTNTIVKDTKEVIADIQSKPIDELNIPEIIATIDKASTLDSATKNELINQFRNTTSPEKQKELYELYKQNFL